MRKTRVLITARLSSGDYVKRLYDAEVDDVFGVDAWARHKIDDILQLTGWGCCAVITGSEIIVNTNQVAYYGWREIKEEEPLS